MPLTVGGLGLACRRYRCGRRQLEVTTFTVPGDLTVYNAGDTATIASKGDLTIYIRWRYGFDPAPNYAGPSPLRPTPSPTARRRIPAR